MSEGLQVTQNSRYASFNGYNGFELPLGMPQQSEFDYTISFWFRSKLSLEQMAQAYYERDAYLFEIKDGPACFIKDAKMLKCNPSRVTFENVEVAQVVDGTESVTEVANEVVEMIEFDLSRLKDFQQWIHVIYSANHRPGTNDARESYSYLRIDVQGFNYLFTGGYAPISDPKIYYGINADRTQGIEADFKEL